MFGNLNEPKNSKFERRELNNKNLGFTRLSIPKTQLTDSIYILADHVIMRLVANLSYDEVIKLKALPLN
jgi:hypothetical protein